MKINKKLLIKLVQRLIISDEEYIRDVLHNDIKVDQLIIDTLINSLKEKICK